MDDMQVAPTGPEHEKAGQAVEDVGAGAAVLLDVRRDDEWAAGHAKGATHWELARLEAGEFPDIPKDAKVYVHCAAGVRAQKAKEILNQNEWNDVTNIGGLEDWETAGGEIE
jgi:rhodanese-related sulfurtransferase